jgi:hypothetical protein
MDLKDKRRERSERYARRVEISRKSKKTGEKKRARGAR